MSDRPLRWFLYLVWGDIMKFDDSLITRTTSFKYWFKTFSDSAVNVGKLPLDVLAKLTAIRWPVQPMWCAHLWSVNCPDYRWGQHHSGIEPGSSNALFHVMWHRLSVILQTKIFTPLTILEDGKQGQHLLLKQCQHSTFRTYVCSIMLLSMSMIALQGGLATTLASSSLWALSDLDGEGPSRA